MDSVIDFKAAREAKAPLATAHAKAAEANNDPFDTLAALVERLSGLAAQLAGTVANLEVETARNRADIVALRAEIDRMRKG
jgi:lipopolysaccharide biosynthesis protein